MLGYERLQRTILSVVTSGTATQAWFPVPPTPVFWKAGTLRLTWDQTLNLHWVAVLQMWVAMCVGIWNKTTWQKMQAEILVSHLSYVGRKNLPLKILLRILATSQETYEGFFYFFFLFPIFGFYYIFLLSGSSISPVSVASLWQVYSSNQLCQASEILLETPVLWYRGLTVIQFISFTS